MSDFSHAFTLGLSQKSLSDDPFHAFWQDLVHELDALSESLRNQHNRSVHVDSDGILRAKLSYEGRLLRVSADICLLRLEAEIFSSCYRTEKKEPDVTVFLEFTKEGPLKAHKSNLWSVGDIAGMEGFHLYGGGWSLHSQVAEQLLGILIFPRTVSDDFKLTA